MPEGWLDDIPFDTQPHSYLPANLLAALKFKVPLEALRIACDTALAAAEAHADACAAALCEELEPEPKTKAKPQPASRAKQSKKR